MNNKRKMYKYISIFPLSVENINGYESKDIINKHFNDSTKSLSILIKLKLNDIKKSIKIKRYNPDDIFGVNNVYIYCIKIEKGK